MTKANSPGYLLPENLQPDENICVCVPIPKDERHILAFLGQLLELGYWFTWERDDEHKGTLAAQPWRDIYQCVREEINAIMTNNCGCGCDDAPNYTRINPDTGVYEVSDDGIIWTPDPASDPRVSAPTFPGIAGEDGLEKRCKAANSVVALIEDTNDKEHQGLVDNITYADALALLTGILTALGIITLGIPLAVAAILNFVVNLFARMIPADFAAQFTTDTWNDFHCIVYCHTEDDGSYTEGGWQAIKQECVNDIGGYAGQWLADHVNLFGVVGMTNAARSNWDGGRECDDCACSNGCAEKYEIYTHLPGDYGTIIEYGENYIDVAPGIDGYATISTVTPGDCCYVTGAELLSGTGGISAFKLCGTGYGAPFIGATPIGNCCEVIESQFTVAGVIRIFFDECPPE